VVPAETAEDAQPATIRIGNANWALRQKIEREKLNILPPGLKIDRDLKMKTLARAEYCGRCSNW
jgi:hypothetical protein